MISKTDLLIQLYELKAIQFGNFTLRSGLSSPFYLDFRHLVSYPKLHQQLCKHLWKLIQPLDFDLLCGVPYAAMSFATTLSVLHERPMIVKRKERKKYGTKKLLEGTFKAGQKCLVIEDTMTSGGSLLETLTQLKASGLEITDAIVIVDRAQGGAARLARKGCRIHTLFTIQEILDILLCEKKITPSKVVETLAFIQSNQFKNNFLQKKITLKQSYQSRIASVKHPSAKRLLAIAEAKQTNLICSADVDTKAELLALAQAVAPHICALKTHVDILADFDSDCVKQLKELSTKHQFLLFEDRKFADIGNTVRLQFMADAFQISDWADLVTVHVIGGASTIHALKLSERLDVTGLVVIAEMSTKDTLTDKNYITKALQIVDNQKDTVVGIVAQTAEPINASQLKFSPGIHLHTNSDTQGQIYNTPKRAIRERGADFIIVGRGIYRAENPEQAAAKYRQAAWQAYQSSIAVLESA